MAATVSSEPVVPQHIYESLHAEPPALEEILFVQLYTLACLVPLLLISTKWPGDMLWMGALGLALLGPMAYSAFVVVPEMRTKRERLLASLRQQASAKGAMLGNNFEFEDWAIQKAYELHCMAGGGWLLDNLAACARLVGTWLLLILLHGKDVYSKLWTILAELVGQWLGLSVCRGVAVVMFGTAQSRRINAVLVPLCIGLAVTHLRCWDLFGLSPILTAAPCSEQMAPVMTDGEMGLTVAVRLIVAAVIAQSALTYIFAGIIPLLPADLHLIQSAPHLMILATTVCILAGNTASLEKMRIVCVFGAISFGAIVIGVMLSCHMWRRTESHLVLRFLTSQRFYAVTGNEHHNT